MTDNKPKDNLCCGGSYECGASHNCDDLCKHFEEKAYASIRPKYAECAFRHRDDQVVYCSSRKAHLDCARAELKDLEQELDYQGEPVVKTPVTPDIDDYFCPECKTNLEESWEYCADCGIKLNWEGCDG